MLRYILSKRVWLITVALGFVLLFLLIFAIPWFLPKDSFTIAIENSKKIHAPLYEKDPVLGVRPRANASLSLVEPDMSGSVNTYHIGSNGWRVVPGANEKTLGKFLLFFGCSFTFGQGLNDEDTLPAYAGKLDRESKPYNFGFLGYGTQHMYCQLARANVLEGVKEKTGTAVYVYMSDHMSRLLGSVSLFNAWLQDHPYLYLRGDTVVYGGTFEEGRPFTNTLYRFIWARRRILPLSLSRDPSPQDYHLLSRVVKESEKIFKARFPEGKFIVLNYPDPFAKENVADKTLEGFRKEGLIVVDGRNAIRPDENNFFRDDHPKPVANKKMAVLLLKSLKGE